MFTQGNLRIKFQKFLGGEELAPLEMEMASLNKTLDQLECEIAEAELFWLKQQHELVKINQQRDKKSKEVKVLTKKVTILQQKKLRVENDIEADQLVKCFFVIKNWKKLKILKKNFDEKNATLKKVIYWFK